LVEGGGGDSAAFSASSKTCLTFSTNLAKRAVDGLHLVFGGRVLLFLITNSVSSLYIFYAMMRHQNDGKVISF
jgi:hypothetical protein